MSRHQAFDDLLHLSVCALGHPLMETEYLETVQRHAEGKHGGRGVDRITRMFAELVGMIEDTREDILGDLFQGAISRGEAGQFLTPMSVCRMMASMQLPTEATDLNCRRSVADQCCGSGRMLIAAAEIQPNWKFVGQDVDLNCVRMTAINLALRNVYGHVIWGNTLGNEQRLVYETGRVEVWGNAIRKCSLADAPEPVRETAASPVESTGPAVNEVSNSQLRLF